MIKTIATMIVLAGTLVVSPPATGLEGDKPAIERHQVRLPGRGANA